MGKLSLKNGLAFVVCTLIGYAVAIMLPPGPWVIYVSMLLSYHLFLAWLVINAEHEVGFSLPIVSSVLTHLCCMALVVSLPSLRHAIPFFSFLRIGVTYLATFECGWLFRAGTPSAKPELPSAVARKREETKLVEAKQVESGQEGRGQEGRGQEIRGQVEPQLDAPRAIAFELNQNDEHHAWIQYLSGRDRKFRRPGVSVREEFQMWEKGRSKSREALRVSR